MLSLLGRLIGLIPGVLNFAENWQKNAYDAKVRIMTARIGGDKARAEEIVKLAMAEKHEQNTWLSIIASSPLLTWLIILFALPLVIFAWKVVVIDKVIGPGCIFNACWDGSTDAIKGQVAEWANTIIVSIFGSATAIPVAKMIFANRSDKGP